MECFNTSLLQIYWRVFSERILKIGKHLAKLRTRLWCLVFFDSQCVYFQQYYSYIILIIYVIPEENKL